MLSRKAHFPDSVLSDGHVLSSSSSLIALPCQPSSTWVTFGPAASLNWTVEAGWPGEESPRFGEWRFGFYSQLSILGQAWPSLSGLSCSCSLQRLGSFLFWTLFFFLTWTIFSVYWICYNISSVVFCFFFFFGHEACGILTSRPGIKPIPPTLEGKFLTTRPPGRPVF